MYNSDSQKIYEKILAQISLKKINRLGISLYFIIEKIVHYLLKIIIF